MMKIRLARWMCQGPIGFTAAGFFDHHRETETPCRIAWQARQAIQIQRGLQFVARAVRAHFDAGRAYLARNRHPTSVAAEPISRPLRRGRKVELVVRGARRCADECLEAGVPSKLIAARGSSHGRQAEIDHLAGHEIVQHQVAGAWTRGFHFDVCRCTATRFWMKF